ncbi:Acetyltransferase (GNAT) family protein [Curtobacterium sp. UNCCL20]|nr:Acetyltransferase (GNAT) family protein [Curtobacterium sp. UNCCL20]
MAEVDGEAVGAAWCLLLTAEAARSGHVDDAFPELVIGVVEERRGLGLGCRLLEAMIEACRLQGVEAVSLHVARRNHRARGMYERFGFETVREHTSGTVMILRLIV